jgi:Family of unknown function (DUF5670)
VAVFTQGKEEQRRRASEILKLHGGIDTVYWGGSNGLAPFGVNHASVQVINYLTTRSSIMPRYALETIIIILLLIWLFGAFISPFGGGLIHLLLAVVLVVVVVRLMQGQRVL